MTEAFRLIIAVKCGIRELVQLLRLLQVEEKRRSNPPTGSAAVLQRWPAKSGQMLASLMEHMVSVPLPDVLLCVVAVALCR